MPPLQVNIDDPDFERHPLFQFARPSQCILEPGEVLFVPAGSGILVFFFLRVAPCACSSERRVPFKVEWTTAIKHFANISEMKRNSMLQAREVHSYPG